ncbi:hypothetical protein LR021_03130 [Candidatus Bipolaricaulota bacterium]|nr:hypothetical protein [Candidatus Bipolaricaulota bacterium]
MREKRSSIVRGLFASESIAGRALNRPMTTEAGERVAYGVYLPSARFFSDVALQDLTPEAVQTSRRIAMKISQDNKLSGKIRTIENKLNLSRMKT